MESCLFGSTKSFGNLQDWKNWKLKNNFKGIFFAKSSLTLKSMSLNGALEIKVQRGFWRLRGDKEVFIIEGSELKKEV